jgi:hypothetical protein
MTENISDPAAVSPEEAAVLLPATPEEVPAFLKRTDLNPEQAKRVQNLINFVVSQERLRLKPVKTWDQVEVWTKEHDWIPGRVGEMRAGLITVETQYGPTTIMAKTGKVRHPNPAIQG